MSKTKAKGTTAETAVANYLASHGFPYAERRTTNGNKDRGDIAGVPGVVIEVKNCAKVTPAGWLDEATTEAANAGVDCCAVWFKRRGKTDPGRWFVLMSGETFTELIR